MPSSLILAAVFGDTLMAGAALGAFGYAAASFAIDLAVTYAVSSLLFKQPQQSTAQSGTEIQLGPATDNKLPVVYGNRYAKPIITDAIISSDQKVMWYVLALSEVTSGSVSFGDVYYDGHLLIFDPDNPNEITGWYTQPKKHSKVGGQYNTKPAGKLEMYFYRNGSLTTGTTHNCYYMVQNDDGSYNIGDLSTGTTTIDAISLLQDSSIPANTQWTSYTKMNNSVFAVLKLTYDQTAGIYGLGSMDFKIQNTLQAPGDVFLDYFTNTNYGCGVDLINVNTASLAQINTISAQPLSIVDTDGNTVTNTFTYQINGVVDTTADCLTTLNYMSDACDSWINWDERLGQWGVIPNISLAQSGGSTATMRVITSDNIIGGINLTPTDLQTSANQITIQFPNAEIINQTDYRYYWLEDQFKSPNEPLNNVDVNMPFVSDSIQATYLGYRKLLMSREDIVITFSMDYSGIGLNAGDIVAINHEWYGWAPANYNGLYCPGKPFRLTQVKEAKDGSGVLSVQITAQSYNDSLYYTMNPHFYTPDVFGIAVDQAYTSAPGQPSVTANNPTATVPNFVVTSEIPFGGIVNAMELWYGLTNTTPFDSTWLLLETTQGNGQPFTNSTTSTQYYINFDVTSLQSGTYYFATRAYGINGYSQFSAISTSSFTWSPNVSAQTSVDSTNASNVLMNNGVGDYYITHSSASSGNAPQYADTNLKYNSSSQTLTTPKVAATTGTVTTMNINSVANLSVLTAPPASYTTGTMAMADNLLWHPVTPQTNTGTAYLTVYNGSSWVKLG